jgi:hypothetical protein
MLFDRAHSEASNRWTVFALFLWSIALAPTRLEGA